MYNRDYNTKAVIEAGLISALVVVIMLISVYIPVIGMIGTLVLPVPITVLYIRHNYKVALSAVIISGILIAMLYNPIAALKAVIIFGITGITLGYCIKHNKSVGKTMCILALSSCIVIILNFAISLIFIDKEGMVGFFNKNLNMLKESMSMNKSIFEKSGASKQYMVALNNMEESLKLLTADLLLKLLPATLVIFSFVSAFLNYNITRSILKKLKYEIKPIKPFSEWYVNTRIGTLVVVFLIIGLLLAKNKSPLSDYFTFSSQQIFIYILIINGLSLATFYLRRKFNISKGLSIFIMIFTLMQLPNIFLFAGLIDMIIDFRKLDPYRRPKEQ